MSAPPPKTAPGSRGGLHRPAEADVARRADHGSMGEPPLRAENSSRSAWCRLAVAQWLHARSEAHEAAAMRLTPMSAADVRRGSARIADRRLRIYKQAMPTGARPRQYLGDVLEGCSAAVPRQRLSAAAISSMALEPALETGGQAEAIPSARQGMGRGQPAPPPEYVCRARPDQRAIQVRVRSKVRRGRGNSSSKRGPKSGGGLSMERCG